MRYVFRRKTPSFTRVLLVESGSRCISEMLLPTLRRLWRPDLMVDLVTCYAGIPAGFPREAPAALSPHPTSPVTRVFRTGDYRGHSGRQRLYRELRPLGHSVVGIICSGEPIMTKWKWALALRLPAKVFIVNENADFFWLDYTQWRLIRHFILFRAGLTGGDAVRTLTRALLFPFTILYLLVYAATVHVRRKVHG
jgi:hypothetical protein